LYTHLFKYLYAYKSIPYESYIPQTIPVLHMNFST
jgi:hypothetical protein